MIVGYVGHLEVYNEDASKRFYSGKSSDFGEHSAPLQNAAFLCSCSVETENGLNFLFVGTSIGEIYKYTITKSNSIIFETKYSYSTMQPITSICADNQTLTVAAGTSNDHKILLSVGGKSDTPILEQSNKANFS